jgi:hypothetical protein
VVRESKPSSRDAIAATSAPRMLSVRDTGTPGSRFSQPDPSPTPDASAVLPEVSMTKTTSKSSSSPWCASARPAT